MFYFKGIDIGPKFSMEYVSPRICRVWNSVSEATYDRDFDLDSQVESEITHTNQAQEKKFRQISQAEEQESIIIYFRSDSGMVYNFVMCTVIFFDNISYTFSDTTEWDNALRKERDALYFPEIVTRNYEFSKALHLAIWERVNIRSVSRNMNLKKLYYGIMY